MGTWKVAPEKRRLYWRAWHARNRTRQLELARRRKGFPEPTRPAPKRCECCREKAVKGGSYKLRSRALTLDHCHSSGKFRGWLCARCNLGLGMLGDTLAAARRMVRYLERNS